MNIHMQWQTTGMPYLLKDKQWYNKLHDPECVQNARPRATPSLSIVHNYVSAFTTNKPDVTLCTVIYSLSVVAVFRHAQDRNFT